MHMLRSDEFIREECDTRTPISESPRAIPVHPFRVPLIVNRAAQIQRVLGTQTLVPSEFERTSCMKWRQIKVNSGEDYSQFHSTCQGVLKVRKRHFRI